MKNIWKLILTKAMAAAVASIIVSTMVSTMVSTFGIAYAGPESERLGHLEIADFYLAPTYSFRESRHLGSFDLGSSYVAMMWTRDPVISAVLKLGSRSLLGLPVRYGPNLNPEQVAVIEGYGQSNSDFGRFRFGLIPIAFGNEGGDVERHLTFPRSLVFQTRYMLLRDYGVSYHIANEGFFSDWTIHNGEGGPDLDNEIWFTGRLGWQSNRSFLLGLTGTTGRTTRLSTDPKGLGNAALPDAGIDVTQPARYRIVNLALEWFLRPLRLEAEGTAGEAIQGDNVVKMRALHTDLELTTGPVNWLARYEILSPRNDVSGNQIMEYSLGLSWHSRYDNSVLSLIGTKKVIENVSLDEHRALVMWRLTPVAGALAGDSGI